MSQQSYFGTINLVNGTAVITTVDLGFTPGYISLINLTQLQSPTATNGYKAFWQSGMGQATAMTTIFGASATFYPEDRYLATNGISLVNALGSEQGSYGTNISAFTNANPGVITVASTYAAQITAGCIIRVSLLADDQSGLTLNGDYYVASTTSTSITVGSAPAGLWTQTVLNSPNTTANGVYVSGGTVTLLQNANATVPNPPNNIYSDVPPWYNDAVQGFSIGTSTFANAGTTDTILVAAWDFMQP